MIKIGFKSLVSEYLYIDCDCECGSVDCEGFMKSAGMMDDVEN
jgi:hypothetical protein